VTLSGSRGVRQARPEVPAGLCDHREITITDGGDGVFDPRPLRTDDVALAVEVAASFCATYTTTFEQNGHRQQVDEGVVQLLAAEAMCIGEGLIAELGGDRVRELQIGERTWAVLRFGLQSGPKVHEPEARAIGEVFRGCTEQWEMLFITTVTQGAPLISEESAACTRDHLDDDQSFTILVGEMDRAYDDGEVPDATPFGTLSSPSSTRTTPASLRRSATASTSTEHRRSGPHHTGVDPD
jgi:hypothetical protein